MKHGKQTAGFVCINHYWTNFSALLNIDFQFFEENEKKFTPNLINCVDLPVSDHGKDVPYSSSGYVCS